jgi:hypothetical protein
MSAGLYSKAHVARWMGKRPQEIQRLIDSEGLPAVPIPTENGNVDKITLHGLHRWNSERAKGGKFMTVEQLAAEMEMCRDDSGDQAEELALLAEISDLADVIGKNLRNGLPSPRARQALDAALAQWGQLERRAS